MDLKWNMLITFLLLIFRFHLANADCSSLPVVENTSNNATGPGPYMSGTVVKFECDIGFNPTGSGKIYICSGHEWTKGNLICVKIYCGRVETPENGIVKNDPTNEIGTSIIFDCKEGYDMIGQPNLLCSSDGNWRPRDPPACQIKMCGEFGSIQHADTFQDSTIGIRNGYGSEVRVTCKSGYVIDGTPVVMCQADGSWGKRPVCKEMTCPHYPGLNSSCIKNTQVHGNFLYMMCKSDVPVTKTGQNLIECSEGQWEKTDEIMACYCNCKVVADLTFVSLKNVNEEYLNHTLSLDWSCKEGSTKQVTEPLVCNDGNILKPVCKSSSSHTTDTPVTDKDGSTVNPPITKSPETDSKESDITFIIALLMSLVALVVLAILGGFLYKKHRKNNPESGQTVSYNKSTENEAIADESEKIKLTKGSEGEAV